MEISAGKLNRVRFFVLLRLVAHAQANGGSTVDSQLQFVEPPSLPVFDPNRVLGNKANSTTGDVETPNSGTEKTTHLLNALQRVGQQENGAFYIEPLSHRDKRKYASIFIKSDPSGSG